MGAANITALILRILYEFRKKVKFFVVFMNVKQEFTVYKHRLKLAYYNELHIWCLQLKQKIEMGEE